MALFVRNKTAGTVRTFLFCFLPPYEMNETFTTTIAIRADPGKVWATLTDFELMNQWMGEPEINIQVSTDWKIESL